MPAYVVVEIDVHDEDLYERYKTLVPSSIAAYGGRYLVRGGPVDVLEGDWHPRRLVILEFADMNRARAWWASAEYAEAKALRLASAGARLLVADGLEPAP